MLRTLANVLPDGSAQQRLEGKSRLGGAGGGLSVAFSRLKLVMRLTPIAFFDSLALHRGRLASDR